MTLDSLGHTNLTMKKKRHNEAVLYARRWFRGLFIGAPPNEEEKPQDDGPRDTFDAANLTGFTGVRDAVLAIEPIFFPDEKDDPT